MVAVEARVLGIDHGPLKHLRDLGQGDVRPVLLVEAGEEIPVGGVDPRGFARGRVQRLHGGEVAADRQRRSHKNAEAGEQNDQSDQEPRGEVRGQDDEILLEPARVSHAGRPSERATSATGFRRVRAFRGSAHDGHLFGDGSCNSGRGSGPPLARAQLPAHVSGIPATVYSSWWGASRRTRGLMRPAQGTSEAGCGASAPDTRDLGIGRSGPGRPGPKDFRFNPVWKWG